MGELNPHQSPYVEKTSNIITNHNNGVEEPPSTQTIPHQSQIFVDNFILFTSSNRITTSIVITMVFSTSNAMIKATANDALNSTQLIIMLSPYIRIMLLLSLWWSFFD